MTSSRHTSGRRAATRPKSKSPKGVEKKTRWSQAVTEHSNALDLEPGVFTWSPKKMAQSLKHSAEQSERRKSSPFRSALSMLTFYENRAGKNLPPARKAAIREAKVELRKLYGRPS